MIYDLGGGKLTKNVPVSEVDRNRFVLSEDDILTLAHWGCKIEDHFSMKNSPPVAMDMEWAKDGETGELFIVQARPETVQSQKSFDLLETFHLKERGKALVTGRAVGERIAHGRVRMIDDVSKMHELQHGEVLVTEKTDPDWEPIMKRAAAIVTNRGGRTCHAAIVSPGARRSAIVGCVRATEAVQDGQHVTVSCAEGDTGTVYDGQLAFEVEKTTLTDTDRPRTQVMMTSPVPTKRFHCR